MDAAGRLTARFVSAPLVPSGELFDAAGMSRGEPPLPLRFDWAGEILEVTAVMKTWRSTTTDRGDSYLARHWYELQLHDARSAVIYFDRKARPGRPHWWLYTIEGPED